MGGFQGGSPCPKRPLAPSQSATLAVTSAGACHRVTKFWQAVCPAAWCSPTVALCSCTLPGRTLSRPKPDPQPRISSTILSSPRLLESVQKDGALPKDGEAEGFEEVGHLKLLSVLRNCAASVAAAAGWRDGQQHFSPTLLLLLLLLCPVVHTTTTGQTAAG